MAESPFNRSNITRRSPTTAPDQPPTPESPSAVPPEVVSTPDIHEWMKKIEACLNEVCNIATEGKLNSEQKTRVHALCRRISFGTSQFLVQYQSLKCTALQNYNSLQALTEKQDLSLQLQTLQKSIQLSSKPAAATPSFADMVKKSENKYIQPLNLSSLAIYPTTQNVTSEETKTLVQKIIRPGEMKLQVRGLRKTKNGGVIISTDSKGDIEKLKQSEQLTSSGLTVDEPRKRKPRITVIGVPTAMTEMEVFTCIFQQNLADNLQNMNLEKFLSSIKLSHKSGRREAESCNYIIEVPADIRKALITKDRLFINWSSCPVRDFTLVTRCYNCQQYGHAAKTCKQENPICGHCGVAGHAIKECPKKDEPPKCASCMHFKKPCDHKTGDVDCPAKKMAEKRLINSVDYDGA